MQPNIWLHRQPIPKLRSTIKYLSSWSNQDILALALKEFNSLDLDNKQIQTIIKLLKQETVSKVDRVFYTPDVDTLASVQILIKPNKYGNSFVNQQESIDFAISIIQDSKVPWEEAHKSYRDSSRPKLASKMSIPLPDNAEDTKKYWGLQAGDKLQDTEGNIYVVTQVKPVLDGAPTVTYEKLELQP